MDGPHISPQLMGSVRAFKEVKIRSPSNKPDSPLSEGLTCFRKFALGLVLLGALGVYAYPKIFQTVNSKLAGMIEKQLNEKLQPLGLRGSVTDARFVEGKGVQVTGLKLTSAQGQKICGIEKTLIHAPAQLPDLISGNFKPTAFELFGLSVNLSRDSSGTWNIEQLLPELAKLKPSGDPIPIAIHNSAIRFTDYGTRQPAVYDFDNLQLTLQPDPTHPRLISLDGSVNLFGQSPCTFSTRPASDETTQIAFDFAKLPINRYTLGLLPAKSHPTGLRAAMGMVDGKGSFALDNATKQIRDVDFQANLSGGSVDHELSPHLVSACYGPFTLKNGILKGDITGKIGSGEKLHGQFHVVAQQILASPTIWRIDGVCKQLTMDHRLAKPFPEGVKKFFSEFDPRGIADVNFSFAHDQNGLQKTVNSTMSKMRFNFIKFPYPVHDAHGRVDLVGDELTFDIVAEEQGQPLHFTGSIMGRGNTTNTTINFWNEGRLPIDQKLATAVATIESVAPNLFAFRPRGFFRVTGQARKPYNAEYFDLDYDVQLIDCQSQHEYFEYPFAGINGQVSVRNSDVQIKDVRSSNGSSTAICNGNWNSESGLHLEFDVHNAPMNQQLADALTPEVRYAWDAIRPDGIAHYVHVDLSTPPGSETNVVIDSVLADPQNPASSQAAINPLWFPYRISNMDGRIRIGNGKFRMDNMRGKHDKSWLACNGFGGYTTNDWKVQFSDLRIGALSVDDDLLNAVPETLRESLAGLNYRGNASATGTVSMGGSLLSSQPASISNGNAFTTITTTTATTTSDQVSTVTYEQPVDQFVNGTQTEPEPSFDMDWDIRVDVDQGAMNVGMEVENVFGYVTLRGNYDGKDVVSVGAIAVDSLHTMDMQVTDVRGPLWIDTNRVGVGSMAKPDNDPNLRESLIGNAFGGTIKLDGQSWTENGGDRFYVQTLVSNSNLQSAVGHMSPQLKEIGGVGNLSMRLAGGETRESIRGEGLFQVRDANIYDLPVVLGMLKTLKHRRTNRSAFDAGNVDFTISGNNVNLNRVELLGDAISLIGEGELDLRGEVGMNFYSVMGRNRMHIPIISDLAKASSQRIMWWKVDGSFSEPQIYAEMLPGLTEGMSDLFQVEDSQPPRWAQDPFSANTIQR